MHWCIWEFGHLMYIINFKGNYSYHGLNMRYTPQRVGIVDLYHVRANHVTSSQSDCLKCVA